MNPIQTSHPSGSNASLILMRKDEETKPCITDKLRKCALAIGSLVFLTLVATFTAFIILGLTHFSIVLGLIISLALSGVMLASLYRLYRPCREKLPIPPGFLSVIKQEFPQEIYDLTIQERLTLQELRIVLTGLSSGTFTFPSPESQKKLERFGVERLQKACEGIQLPYLENLLLKRCPFYFIKTFIQIGPREFPEAENMDPEVYWLSRTGLTHCLDTAFHHYIWMFSKVVSKFEYETLLSHARNNTWDEASAMLEEVRTRLIDRTQNENVEHFHIDRVWLFSCFSHFSLEWLLYFCKHGVSWDQLQLIEQLECRDVILLSIFNGANGGANLIELILSIYPHIQEDHNEFDASIALLTWEEWIDHYEKHKEDSDWRFYDRTISFLNERRGESLIRKELPHIPIYSINRTTGMRILK
ncbi:Protein of unknown function (DUF1389) [Chlamydia poikilotherma]|uniref:DUF1389 domain-containing protein n=1 Tax=Chlamydia poikilotherma TaxID=1967783 RepID=A0A3B0PPI5_9CHLA|nr:DUF1389 domain-containing protein [Chlamydia poikilotherma]SYX09103.1 Protein of unknown function (DUF1389) [Chlamydia poikilotherma]